MKPVNLKKIFCIMLSAGILVSGARGESSNAKKIFKAAAPYVGFGVPTGALLIGGAVLLAKLLPRGDTNPDGELGTDTVPVETHSNATTLLLSADSGHIVGVSWMTSNKTQIEKTINDAIENGRIPGITFYRYKHSGTTYHCYIINNYKEAEEFLRQTYIDDMKNWPRHWKDVKLFQNRWLSKKWNIPGKKKNWSFEKIFGFEKGFGLCFDKITEKIKDKTQRQGTVDLNNPPEELQNFAKKLSNKENSPTFGKTVFDDYSGMAFNAGEDFELKRCIMSEYDDPEQLRNDYSAFEN